MLHPLGAARLLAGLLLLAAAAGQSDLPLPRRCHLAAPCTATRGCEPLVGGREAWVAGGEGVEVQLGVVCIAQGGSRLYGTAAFFTYEIRAPGSQQLLQQGKFNQYDLGLHAHVSNTLRLPLGEYSLTVLQGALESDRTSIATGQPYTLHAVPTPPPAPVEVANSPSGSGVAAAPDAGADDATPLDVVSPVIREGSLGGEGEQALDEGAVPPPPTGRPRAPDTQAAAQPAAGGDDMVVIIVVAVVALLALSVFGVGLFVYLRGGGPGALTRFSDPASGAPSPDKRASAYTSYGGADADDTSTDPEAGGSKAIIVHAQHREQTPIGLPQMKPNTAEAELMAAEGGLLTPPDFSGVSGPRRPARGKRAKQEGEEEGAQDAIIDGPESRGLIFGGEAAHRSLHPDSAQRRMVSIAGPPGQGPIQVSEFTARLMASKQALPGMFVSSPTGSDGSPAASPQRTRINWSVTGSQEGARLQPLAHDGTDRHFRQRYKEVTASTEGPPRKECNAP